MCFAFSPTFYSVAIILPVLSMSSTQHSLQFYIKDGLWLTAMCKETEWTVWFDFQQHWCCFWASFFALLFPMLCMYIWSKTHKTCRWLTALNPIAITLKESGPISIHRIVLHIQQLCGSSAMTTFENYHWRPNLQQFRNCKILTRLTKYSNFMKIFKIYILLFPT